MALSKRRLTCAFRTDGYLFTFLFGLLLSFLIFLPFLILDRGLFLYYGDYNVQQIPFYSLAHDAVQSGQTGWSWLTDLGANFVGSYSFYLLGSPFFWITLLFPSGAVPYLMAPLLMLKFALTGVTGCAFLRRFVKNGHTAVFGGLLYAFSGFNLYNIFFNHFNEVVMLFPLLLIAMDIAVIIAAVSGELQQQFAFIGDCGGAVLDAEKVAGVEIFDRRQHQLPLADYLFRHCCCGCGGSFAFICRWLLRCVISSYPLLGLWLRRGAVHRLCWCLWLHLGLRVCI